MQCCESSSEERSAGNPHATICGNRRWATASGDPVPGVQLLRSTHQMGLTTLANMPNDPRIQPKLPRPVELLVFPRVQILDVTGPLQVFATANDIAGGNVPPYAIHVVSQAGDAVASSSGIGLLAHPLPPHSSPLDTLIVAGGPGIEAAAADEALVDWVRGRAHQARRFASVCTGAVLLAASGLLDMSN